MELGATSTQACIFVGDASNSFFSDASIFGAQTPVPESHSGAVKDDRLAEPTTPLPALRAGPQERTIMPRLRIGEKEIILAKPTVHSLTEEGGHLVNPSVAALLLVNPLGDFLASKSAMCHLNCHTLLGGIALLQHGDWVDCGFADSNRIQYLRQGPAVRFTQLPRPLRCDYTRLPIADHAVRCTGCFALYVELVWAGELHGCCPRCGWTEGA